MNKQTELFETMPVFKALMTMAIPTIFAQIVVLIYNMADTFYIGQTGNPYMVAAASLILPVFNIAISLANLAGVGGGTLISRLLGLKENEEASRVSSFCVYVAIGISALFSILMFLFMKPILLILGAGEKTYEYARLYSLCVIVFGAIPTVLNNTLSTLIRSEGYSKQAGFGVMMGGILNIFIDPLFMFVLFPKGYEIIGAGIATCFSNCIATLYFVIVIHNLKGKTVLRLLPTTLPKKENIISVFNVGVPSAIVTFLFDMDYVVLDRLMSGYGDLALAAIGIVLKVERLPLNVGIGICQGMMPIVAYNYASKNVERRKETIKTARRFGLLIAAISILLYELFASQLMSVFISNSKTILLGTNFLRVRVLATPLMFLSFSVVYIFNAYGKGEISLFLGIMRWLIFNIPMLFLLNYLIGMNGLVWSQITADILTVICSYLILYQYEKKNFKA